jgi:predicted nucleotidyltransferase
MTSTSIIRALVGSRAYNLHNEQSDYAPLGHYFGFNTTWTGTSSKTLGPPPSETTVYEIARFFDQCVNASPESLDILFSPHVVPLHHPLGSDLLSVREEFLSKKCKHSYSGFAFSQLKRLRDKPRDPHAGKWACNAYRLMSMGYEILTTGKVQTDRTPVDRDQLLDLKYCWLPNRLAEVNDHMEKAQKWLDDAYEESKLRHSPDRAGLNDWLVNRLKTYFLKD